MVRQNNIELYTSSCGNNRSARPQWNIAHCGRREVAIDRFNKKFIEKNLKLVTDKTMNVIKCMYHNVA